MLEEKIKNEIDSLNEIETIAFIDNETNMWEELPDVVAAIVDYAVKHIQESRDNYNNFKKHNNGR